MKHYHLFRYIGIAAMTLLVLGLLGWYFFLRGQQANVAELDAARGFDIAVPSFTGSRSSTAENIEGGPSAETLLTAEGQKKPPRLWRVSTSPIAGAGFIATSTVLRYVERSTGHIYDVDPGSGLVTRRTNTLVPKIYDAGVAGDGSIAMRSLDDTGAPMTLVGRLGTTTDEGFVRFESTNLGASVFAVAPSPTLPEMLLVAARAGGAELVRSSSGEGTPQRLLSLFLTSLEPLWLSDGKIFLTERPASGIAGSAYEVVNGALVPLIRNVPGLSILPRASSGALLYSSDDGARLRLFARAGADASTSEITLQTTAKKCVWTPSVGTTTSLSAYCASPQSPVAAGFTDSWLRGSAHTADAWFTIDLSSAKAEKFFVPESAVALDVERPMMDARGEYIAFMNARDKSLWVLRLKE
jgi:hypothetical protein